VVHQEVGAVLLGRDRIVGGGSEDLDRLHAELHSARRPTLGANRAGDANGRFLRHLIGRFPRLFADFFLENDALQITAAIADDRKNQLAGGSLVVQPPIDGDLFSDMLRKLFDSNVGHKGWRLYADGRVGNFRAGDTP